MYILHGYILQSSDIYMVMIVMNIKLTAVIRIGSNSAPIV